MAEHRKTGALEYGSQRQTDAAEPDYRDARGAYACDVILEDGAGSGVVRAKAWPRDAREPDAWTIEVPHAHAHTHGAAGLYGFTPQSRFAVYLDNLSVTPNE